MFNSKTTLFVERRRHLNSYNFSYFFEQKIILLFI